MQRRLGRRRRTRSHDSTDECGHRANARPDRDGDAAVVAAAAAAQQASYRNANADTRADFNRCADAVANASASQHPNSDADGCSDAGSNLDTRREGCAGR